MFWKNTIPPPIFPLMVLGNMVTNLINTSVAPRSGKPWRDCSRKPCRLPVREDSALIFIYGDKPSALS